MNTHFRVSSVIIRIKLFEVYFVITRLIPRKAVVVIACF